MGWFHAMHVAVKDHILRIFSSENRIKLWTNTATTLLFWYERAGRRQTLLTVKDASLADRSRRD